ncbi:angiotensin-converting enzyme-like [Bradysia coprophila]|uniref:angiotensin-converting enzyme-like n=1 Tax=Bradysia coprophila TaxID=38358 RepID=UPI00187DB484|nr:angiotensin-converting enzyme-like [Bradysia coprophila]XP_037038833.1 angiotensin-converting enzyme-like [Bradysia coprophila]
MKTRNKILISTITLILATTVNGVDQGLEDEEIQAQEYIQELNYEIQMRRNQEANAEWNYYSNITDETERRKLEVSTENAKFYKEKAKETLKYNFHAYQNDDLKRQFEKLTKLGYAALSDDKYRELQSAITSMETNYAKIKVCSFSDRSNCTLQLDPEIESIFAESQNPEELKYYWEQWYNLAGTRTKKDFTTYVRLKNEAARLNNFTDAAQSWLHEYEDCTFEQQLENIFDQIRPLYQQLHAYMRYKLNQKYGNLVPLKGAIPMHILGNMWAQSWDNVAEFGTPYPAKPVLDVTEEMIKQKYTPLKMFQMADEFFESLNMTKVPATFWQKSIIEKPKGVELVCHASAWDFYLTNDVRIKQCTRVTMDQFFTVHHELGHIQYYLQYQHLPQVYREGANPGFHEAVGDVLSLSVSTPKHLKKIGLLTDFDDDEENKINQLYKDALDKIIFLPFAYVLDKYRWGIFRGTIAANEYNCKFWKMREEYSGIVPPVQRSENDFDAPAKYHVSADVEYLRYLVSFIVQFQFHKGACEKAGEYVTGDPDKLLSDCDIYQSTAAGNAIKAMLSLGSSKPWPDAMEVLTGNRKMEATAILEYFAPLYEWLVKTNTENGVEIGWDLTYECAASS